MTELTGFICMFMHSHFYMYVFTHRVGMGVADLLEMDTEPQRRYEHL